jgi:hypothetical protein
MLLTAAHVIGSLFPMSTQETSVVGYGDLASHEPHDTSTAPIPSINFDLATLERSIPPERTQRCSVDAAIARISSDRELRNHLGGEPIMGVRDIREILDTNIQVCMYGAASNMRHGVLNTAPIAERLQVGNSEHDVFYERACYISSRDERPFADRGDSGSIVVDENRHAVAMVVGLSGASEGPAKLTLATPLVPALEALEVELYSGMPAITTQRVSPFTSAGV